MNIGVIFAGGSGTRMKSKDKPKQFLMVHGKPIIVHTIELFQKHSEIDGIIVVCIEEWIPYMNELIYRYRLEKVVSVVPGGETGQLSIYNGLVETERIFGEEDTIVLIHDGVRPLINSQTISDNIASVKLNGSTITCVEAKETIILTDENNEVMGIPDRNGSRLARAPQSFWLKEILEIDRKSIESGEVNMVDSCTLMNSFGKKVSVVIGPSENIKITTPDDFYVFRALYDARENQQLDF